MQKFTSTRPKSLTEGGIGLTSKKTPINSKTFTSLNKENKRACVTTSLQLAVTAEIPSTSQENENTQTSLNP